MGILKLGFAQSTWGFNAMLLFSNGCLNLTRIPFLLSSLPTLTTIGKNVIVTLSEKALNLKLGACCKIKKEE